MPQLIRDRVQEFLYDLAGFCWKLGGKLDDIAFDALDLPYVGYELYRSFRKAADYCWTLGDTFLELMWQWLRLCDWFDNIADDIFFLWKDVNTLWDYVYYTLKGLVGDAVALANTALDNVTEAYDKAVDAWNYATGWLTDRANEAWSRAGAVWGSVTNYLKDLAISAYNKAVWAYNAIAPAITSAKQAIYAWVRSIPAEIKSYVSSVVTSVKSWALGVVNDAKASVLATIAAPINLVLLWFNDIQDFFNDPPGWLWGKIWSYLERYW